MWQVDKHTLSHHVVQTLTVFPSVLLLHISTLFTKAHNDKQMCFFLDVLPDHVRCSFEHGMCDWYNLSNHHDFDWRYHKGPTPATGTGPTVDHTLGTQKGSVAFDLNILPYPLLSFNLRLCIQLTNIFMFE